MQTCFLAWRIFWSESGYRGWDSRLYRRWLEGRLSGGHGYVREHGFGHEWWNFYEGFSNEYYYGYAPPIHSRGPRRCSRFGAIFFVSLNPFIRGWYLVGVYGLGQILARQEIGIRLIDHMADKQLRFLAESTKSELLVDHGTFLLKAPKKYSTVLPKPMPLNMEEDLGLKFFGQSWFKYTDSEKALALLNKAINYVKRLGEGGARQGLWTDPGEALQKLTNLYEALTGEEPPEEAGESIEVPEPRLGETLELPERLIEEALARDLDIVEEGLQLIARQHSFPTGRADIVARGRDGALVIIEVKAGTADDSTLTQLLNYMSAARASGESRVRGYIVARGFSRRLREAVKMLDSVEIVPIGVEVRVFRL